MPVTIRLDDNDTAFQVDADGVVHTADERFTITRIEDGLYRVSDGARRWTVAVAGSGDSRWLAVDGVVARVEVDRDTGARDGVRRKRTAPGTMAAPMPATVRQVLVVVGAEVAKGDTVVMLEAMKMELAIRAPRDGTVKTVNCAIGELVQPGINLVDLE